MLEIIEAVTTLFIVVILLTTMFLFLLYTVEKFVLVFPGILAISADVYGRLRYPHQYRPPNKNS